MELNLHGSDVDPRFKIFFELMGRKVNEVLLVSTPYDAWILEKDSPLAERIVHEYQGLNLSKPPRFTWVVTAQQALAAVEKKKFDLVITMPRLADMDAFLLGRQIKELDPELPVVLLSHNAMPSQECYIDGVVPEGIDHTFQWTGSTDILVSLIKSVEDHMNADFDTRHAGIRIILFVEDSPSYKSSLLPILYRELVIQTQAVMEQGLTGEHRLLAMRARPKILHAENYEEAWEIYKKFEPYVLGVISDVRFPHGCDLDDEAGVKLLTAIKKERFDIPMLLTSSEAKNASKAERIPVDFVDKNSRSLLAEVRSFFIKRLGFGDFVFKMPDGREVARAGSLCSLEKQIRVVPEESFIYHYTRNDFSRWLFTRSEIELANVVRPLRPADFPTIPEHRDHLANLIHVRREVRQKGVVVDFDRNEFDPDTEFMKVGKDSLGGKARGLAFFSYLLNNNQGSLDQFEGVDIFIPQTLVVSTDAFDGFVEKNGLKHLSKTEMPDEEIAQLFLQGSFPSWVADDLRAYLEEVRYPLAVRSSSLLEDAQFRAYAGLYKTYMVPNDDEDIECRLNHLKDAIKLVYASTYFQNPKDFSRRVGNRTEEEKMAVLVQQLVGDEFDGHFYPAISGVAQSHNYYCFGRMKPEEGIATIALGLGRAVMAGERTRRFSPKYPELDPQSSMMEEVLDNAQRHFYTLAMDQGCAQLGTSAMTTLEKREISDAISEFPVKLLSSSYIPAENRIRDAFVRGGYPVMTFAQVLKYDLLPIGKIINEALALGAEGMGCPVEMEFSVNFGPNRDYKPEFAILQLRPMTAREEQGAVEILPSEARKAFLSSANALGNTSNREIRDIVFVHPESFDPAKTPQMAEEIGELNKHFLKKGEKYLLIGPGRWGSADRWLGIPVHWSDISGVGAIVETSFDQLSAEPSQGSHFFHNITSLGINYITVGRHGDDRLDWEWLVSQPVEQCSEHVSHVRLESPLTLKVDGRSSQCVVYLNGEAEEA